MSSIKRLVTVIPVHGREILVKRTIKRLSRQSFKLHAVVGAGFTRPEESAIVSSGADFFRHENTTLGEKWQNGIDYARAKYDPDALLILGSSDWISDGWCEALCSEINTNGWAMAGKRDIYFLDIDKDTTRRIIYWPRYTVKNRVEEPIGAGRIISREILDALNWQIFDKTKRASMDFTCWKRILALGGRVFNSERADIRALSISCPMWGNLHRFGTMHKKNRILVEEERPDDILEKLFPDALTLFTKDEIGEWMVVHGGDSCCEEKPKT